MPSEGKPETHRVALRHVIGQEPQRVGRAIVRADSRHERPGQLAYVSYNPHRGVYSLDYADYHRERISTHEQEETQVDLVCTASELLEREFLRLQGLEAGAAQLGLVPLKPEGGL